MPIQIEKRKDGSCRLFMEGDRGKIVLTASIEEGYPVVDVCFGDQSGQTFEVNGKDEFNYRDVTKGHDLVATIKD